MKQQKKEETPSKQTTDQNKELTWLEKRTYEKLVKKIEKKKKIWEEQENKDKTRITEALWQLNEHFIYNNEQGKEITTKEELQQQELDWMIKQLEDIITELRTTIGMTKQNTGEKTTK